VNDEQKKELQKVIERIEKILALSQNNPNEAEAASAADKVQELLAEYNLTMSDLGNGKGETEVIIRDNDFVTYFAGWIKPLLNSVARLYFCGYLYESFPTAFIKREGLDKHARKLYVGSNSRTYLRHNFIGAEHNTVVAKAMGIYLIDTMEKLVKDALKTVPVSEKTSFKYSFMNACAFRLAARLAERMQATATKGTTNLPALLNIYEAANKKNQEAMAGMFPNMSKPKTSLVRFNSTAGHKAGWEAGEKIGLDTQVDNNKSATLRISH
jgi:hypothetical protein